MAVSKRTGKKSVVANDFLIPLPPGAPIANDVGTNRAFNNGAAVVNFDDPVTSPPTVSYKVYANATGQSTVTATGASSPIVISNLKTNVLYVFTVTGFTEAGAESEPSLPSEPTLITSVPATPTAPTASSPNANQDVVSWQIPNSGGKTITGYIWAASDGKTNAIGGNPGLGPTTNTSVPVNQEAGTAQTYTVYAINANGNSLTSPASNSITTTFSFAPFGFTPFGFSPFGFSPFGFSPFGFSPFKAFRFAPFGAFGFGPKFGFTPFVAFRFAPFRFAPFGAFGFAPRCIASETQILTMTVDGEFVYRKAKDLKVGEFVLSPLWKEYEGKDFIDHNTPRVTYDTFTQIESRFVQVTGIDPSVVSKTVVFNKNTQKHFSEHQPVLAKKQGQGLTSWEITWDIVPGDILVHYDFKNNDFYDELVHSVDVISDKDENVYKISTESGLPFIAGNIVCC
jgi:hypothetical protein